MKKWMVLVLALLMSMSFAAAEEETGSFEHTDSNILVACFSATGNTWPLAEAAAAHLNADLFRIEPQEPYTDADLNYNNDSCRAKREMNDPQSRPALAAMVKNMGQYDTVILAFPIWWGQAPRIIETFIEAHDLSGKTVLTFCTSASSGFGRTGTILSALTDDSVNWLEGSRFAPGTSAEKMVAWLDEKGIAPWTAE